jgi:hypothetical protein
MEFFYDGTRWLSTALHSAVVHPWSAGSTWTIYLTATQGSVARWLLPDVGCDIYVETVHLVAYVQSGSSALSASHKWTYDVDKIDTSNSTTSLGSVDLDSGSNTTWIPKTITIDEAIDPASYPTLRLNITKTGTPGALNVTAPATVTFRYTAT